MHKYLFTFFLIVSLNTISAQNLTQNPKGSKIENKAKAGLPVVKLGFEYTNDSEQRIHRQIAVSFRAGNSFDHENGYDSYMRDLQPTDMYWQFLENGPKYIIIGVQQLNRISQIPVVISITNDQEVKILLDRLENITDPIYLNDFATGQQYNLENPVDIYLTTGVYANRFAITFIENTVLRYNDFSKTKGIKIHYSPTQKRLKVINPNEVAIENLEILNSHGKLLKTHYFQGELQSNILLDEIPSGVYIIKLKTEFGYFTEKVIMY